MDAKGTYIKNPTLQPADDFSSAYANHSFLEPSFWDLKMIFGQLDQSVDPLVVEQHTAITMAWAQVKVFSYFLRLQLAAHEMAHGKIKLPENIVPAEIVAPTEKDIEEQPLAPQIFEEFKKIRDEMFLDT